MSVADQLLGREQKTVVGTLGPPIVFVTFDCLVEAGHDEESQPTALEIEDGSVITDHQIHIPDRVTLQVIHTNYPLLDLSTESINDNRRGTLLDQLQQWKDDGELLSITTPGRSHDNMQITHIHQDEDATKGDAFVGSIRFQEVTLVSTQQVAAPTANAADKAKKVQGKKATPPASPGVATSMAQSWVDWGLGGVPK